MKTLANKITVGRILIVPVFLLFAYLGKKNTALFLFILASVSDLVDGYIARKYNQISNFGKFIDPLADKILVVSALCYFTDLGRFPGWALAIVCFREFAVSGLRIASAGNNKIIAAGVSGKIKTSLSMIMISLMLFVSNNVVDIVSMIIILTTTVYSGCEYFYINRNEFKETIK